MRPAGRVRELGDRAAAHRRQDLDGAFSRELGSRIQVPGVLAIHEDVHEGSERAVAQHACRELRVALGDLADEATEVGRVESERRAPAGRGAERRGEPNGDAHPSTS